LNVEAFETLLEAQVLAEDFRIEYGQRARSSYSKVSACPTCVLPGNPGPGARERTQPETAAPGAIVMALQHLQTHSALGQLMPAEFAKRWSDNRAGLT